MTDNPETLLGLKIKADAAIARMSEELRQLGITSIVASVVLPDWVPADKRIASSINGSGEDVINLIGSLAMQMMPEDYAKLFFQMHTNPLFLRLLEVNNAMQQQASKPTVVN